MVMVKAKINQICSVAFITLHEPILEEIHVIVTKVRLDRKECGQRPESKIVF